jgi:sigma-B regulation protein RsbU (phosphoserine phosphatase)
VLGELLYADRPQLIHDFKVDPGDPAHEHLAPFRSVFAVPQYDNGVATNMVLMLRNEPNAFNPRHAPMTLWMANLFGRSVHALVMAKQLREAYTIVDRELRAVAEIQRSLLPAALPSCECVRLAAHYQTSQQAGGDYYDLFELGDDKLGMLIADVSGHGTPAAVLMAITHTLAHAYPGEPAPPSDVLGHLNQKLADSYTRTPGGFVTAFYGVYDPAKGSLTYASAGHNPPRLKQGAGRSGDVVALTGARDLPLGIASEVRYHEETVPLNGGDMLVLYTDGITEARRAGGRDADGSLLFGERRLDESLRSASADPEDAIRSIIGAVDRFTENAPATDDRTIVAASIK